MSGRSSSNLLCHFSPCRHCHGHGRAVKGKVSLLNLQDAHEQLAGLPTTKHQSQLIEWANADMRDNQKAVSLRTVWVNRATYLLCVALFGDLYTSLPRSQESLSWLVRGHWTNHGLQDILERIRDRLDDPRGGPAGFLCWFICHRSLLEQCHL